MSGHNLRSKGKLGADNAGGHRSAEGKADSAGAAAQAPVSKASFPHIRQVPALRERKARATDGHSNKEEAAAAAAGRQKQQRQQQQQHHATSGLNAVCVYGSAAVWVPAECWQRLLQRAFCHARCRCLTAGVASRSTTGTAASCAARCASSGSTSRRWGSTPMCPCPSCTSLHSLRAGARSGVSPEASCVGKGRVPGVSR